MYERNPIYSLPQTIDEAAETLIGDLGPDKEYVLRNLPFEEIVDFYGTAREAIAEEFRIWDGNDNLLNSCLNYRIDADDPSSNDPAQMIIYRMHEILNSVSVDGSGNVFIN
jgi:hypothetical protein